MNQTVPLDIYLKGYLFDTKAILSAPGALGRQRLVRGGGGCQCGGGSLCYDQDLRDWAQTHRKRHLRIPSPVSSSPSGTGFTRSPHWDCFMPME